MKPTTAYVSVAILGVSLVLLWLYRAGSDDAMLAKHPPAGGALTEDGAARDGKEGIGRKRQHENSKHAAGDRNVTARAKAKAMQGILDGNADLLRQAIEMAPNDPFLLFLGATHSLLTPAEHLELGKRFHEQAPQNALAAFIHASHLLKAGDSATALAILKNSGTCPGYNDCISEQWSLMEASLIQDGHSPTEAKVLGFGKLESGYLIDLRDTVRSLVQMAGDLPADEAASMRSLASYMSRRISDESKSGTVIKQLVGLVMEKSALDGLSDDQPSPYDGLTVAEARKSIEAQRQQLMQLTKYAPDAEQLQKDNPKLLETFIERSIRDGEVAALEWLRDNK